MESPFLSDLQEEGFLEARLYFFEMGGNEGKGLPPEVPSWGSILSWEGRQYMEMAPRLAMWPGVCLTVVVFCFNMFGDAMRDLFDPRLRGGQGSYGAAQIKRKRSFLSRLLNPFS